MEKAHTEKRRKVGNLIRSRVEGGRGEGKEKQTIKKHKNLAGMESQDQSETCPSHEKERGAEREGGSETDLRTTKRIANKGRVRSGQEAHQQEKKTQS